MELKEVHEVRATLGDGLVLDITWLIEGEECRVNYGLSPTDPHGLAPTLREWVKENKPSILPYIPPTATELREAMEPLSRVDFRLRLKKAAITTSVINAAIAAVADEELREDYEIIWEDGQSFGRLDPFVLVVFEYAGKTPEQADSIWNGE